MIIAITEIWLSKELYSFYTYSNYKQFVKWRAGEGGGGVQLFFAPHLKEVQNALPIPAPPSCDTLWVKDVKIITAGYLYTGHAITFL